MSTITVLKIEFNFQTVTTYKNINPICTLFYKLFLHERVIKSITTPPVLRVNNKTKYLCSLLLYYITG